MKHLAKKIFKTVNEEIGEVPDTVNQEIPDYNEVEDHKEAKSVMKVYWEDTINKVENSVEIDNSKNKKGIGKCKRNFTRS